jgi:hypothetical protein
MTKKQYRTPNVGVDTVKKSIGRDGFTMISKKYQPAFYKRLEARIIGEISVPSPENLLVKW